MKEKTVSDKSVIKEVSAYISQSGVAELPGEVITTAKHHILDTIAAIISGSKLKPGELAKNLSIVKGAFKKLRS